MTWPITIGGTAQLQLTQSDCEDAILGYAFGRKALQRNRPLRQTNNVTAGAQPAHCYRWAYRCYDCVPTDPHRLTIGDAALTACMDSQIGAAAISGLEAVLESMSDMLALIPICQTFWALNPATLGLNPPPAGTVERRVWEAWAIPMELTGAGKAITHKILHRKRPWLFPMLDDKTNAVLMAGGAWLTIYNEISNNQAEFEDLERFFASEAAERGGVSLTRLRIHDILVWGSCVQQLQAMIAAGQQLRTETQPLRIVRHSD